MKQELARLFGSVVPLGVFGNRRVAVVAVAYLAIVVGAAILAPVLSPYDPNQVDLRSARTPPNGSHLLGTDILGYDIWTRLLYGSRVTLVAGFGAVAIATVVGTAMGMISGYVGGTVDQVIGRIIDTILSLPGLLVIVVFVAIVGPSLASVIAVIALLTWPNTARFVRAQVLSLRDRDFILAARLIGGTNTTIITRHILPNVLGPLSAIVTFDVARAILLEAGVSFLGLGVQPPTASWGSMANQATNVNVLQLMPWVWLPPTVAIALTILSVNILGDLLRDAIDPRSRSRVPRV